MKVHSVDDTRLYSIGELARRTGLSVKTIRFYSDSGVVPPTDRTHSGYRLYDVSAIARLELVRTLRDLGAGLDEVRLVLGEETTLQQLARTHLELLEGRLRTLRARRAVLRAVVKQDSTTEELRLMHKIAGMSDEERNRLVDEFWNETTEGLNVNPEFIAWMRSAKPQLPDDPSTEQLEAWIELAELVADPDFRERVRTMNAEQAELRDSGREPDTSSESAKESWGLLFEVTEARKAGASVESSRELIDRFVDAFRNAAAEKHETEADVYHQLADTFEQHDRRLSRYWELLATINGWPEPQTLSVADTEWLVATLRARAS
ncbi:helix-turn-helix domain-containing protein [Parasphingorhabdus pacifica]